jgi:hypothetical protein
MSELPDLPPNQKPDLPDSSRYLIDRLIELEEKRLELQRFELENNRDASNQAFDVAMEQTRNVPVLVDKEHKFLLTRELRWMGFLLILVGILVLFVFTGHEYIAGILLTAILSLLAGRALPNKKSTRPNAP